MYLCMNHVPSFISSDITRVYIFFLLFFSAMPTHTQHQQHELYMVGNIRNEHCVLAVSNS